MGFDAVKEEDRNLDERNQIVKKSVHAQPQSASSPYPFRHSAFSQLGCLALRRK
jgi:hypothetical protein